MKNFDNKIAVITGGGSGIGRALILELANAGCHIALCDISETDMEETALLCREAIERGVRITRHVCDVASETQLIRFREEIAEQHSTDHINLLFNNAGVSGGQSFVRDDRENWDRVFDICWGGVYLGCRVFLPMLQASKEAHIINTSSVNGFWACLGGNIEHTAYSSAKFAVKGFTEALSVDLRKNAPHIKVSVVMPGHIGTSIALNSQKLAIGEPQDMDDTTLDDLRQRWTALNPDAARLSNDMVRSLARKSGEDFRDNAPTSAEQAAGIILDGVRNERWRILVGDDAEKLDEAVRADPENAYEENFFSFISPAVG